MIYASIKNDYGLVFFYTSLECDVFDIVIPLLDYSKPFK